MRRFLFIFSDHNKMPWWGWLLTITAVISILYIIFWIFLIVGMFKVAEKVIKTETFEDGKEKVKVMLFYAVWCPHCEQYLESNVFMDTYAKLKKTAAYDAVVFVQLDYDKNTQLANKLGVRAFPSIVAVTKDDQLINEFDGNRYDSAELERFVAKSLTQA